MVILCHHAPGLQHCQEAHRPRETRGAATLAPLYTGNSGGGEIPNYPDNTISTQQTLDQQSRPTATITPFILLATIDLTHCCQTAQTNWVILETGL